MYVFIDYISIMNNLEKDIRDLFLAMHFVTNIFQTTCTCTVSTEVITCLLHDFVHHICKIRER